MFSDPNYILGCTLCTTRVVRGMKGYGMTYSQLNLFWPGNIQTCSSHSSLTSYFRQTIVVRFCFIILSFRHAHLFSFFWGVRGQSSCFSRLFVTSAVRFNLFTHASHNRNATHTHGRNSVIRGFVWGVVACFALNVLLWVEGIYDA
jgi:hypothetical protein